MFAGAVLFAACLTATSSAAQVPAGPAPGGPRGVSGASVMAPLDIPSSETAVELEPGRVGRRPPRPALRVVTSLAFGLSTVGLSTFLGGAMGAAASPGSEVYAALGGGLLGFGGGYLLYPLAAWGGAKVVDGHAHLGGAYLGSLAGGAVGAGLFAAAYEPPFDDVRATALGLLAALTAASGPIIGSEIAAALDAPEGSGGIAPSVGVSPEGEPRFVLVGRF